MCESKLVLCFCKSLIIKYSHGDIRIEAKNSVLKQAKMVSIYQKNNTKDTKKKAAKTSLILRFSLKQRDMSFRE